MRLSIIGISIGIPRTVQLWICLVLVLLACIALGQLSSPTEGASDQEWVNDSNITSVEEIWDISVNSLDETLTTMRARELYIWGMDNHTNIKRVSLPTTGEYISMDWSDDQRLYAWAQRGGAGDLESDLWRSDLVLFDEDGIPVDGYQPYGSIEAYEERISTLQWSPTSSHLAVAYRDGTIRIIDVVDGSIILSKDSQFPVTQISWSPKGNLLMVVQDDRINNTDKISLIDLPNDHLWYAGRLQEIIDVDWSMNGSTIFLSSFKGIYQIDPGKWEGGVVNEAAGLYIASCPTRPVLAIFGNNGVTFWDYGLNESEHHHSTMGQMPQGEWTLDGSHLYTVDENEVIRIWRKVVPIPRPIVGISTPFKEEEVFGVVEVTGWAFSSKEDTLHVLIQVNNQNWTEAIGSVEWSYSLDSTSIPDGITKLRVRAHDIYGVSDVSIVTIWVRNNPPPDDDPPTILIDEPANGTTVWGIITLDGEAWDDNAVLAIQIKIDGLRWQSIPIDAVAAHLTWTYDKDVFFIEEGELEISARSFDGVHFSAVETRTVNLKPPSDPVMNISVQIISPAWGKTVPPDTIIRGIVDEGCAELVFISIDHGNVIPVLGTYVWSYQLSDLEEGAHDVRAIASNGTIFSEWVSVAFFVSHDLPSTNIAPEIGIIYPEDSLNLTKEFLIMGWSFDDVKVEVVEVSINEEAWRTANGNESWSYQVVPEDMDRGWNVIQARAYDGEEYGYSSMVTVRFIDGTESEFPVERIPAYISILLITSIIIIIILVSILIVTVTRHRN
jgi:WD40 repeat protein